MEQIKTLLDGHIKPLKETIEELSLGINEVKKIKEDLENFKKKKISLLKKMFFR
jgi:hypothetical protein